MSAAADRARFRMDLGQYLLVELAIRGKCLSVEGPVAVGTGSHRQTLLVPEVAAEDEIQGTGAALWADEVE